MLIVNSLIKIYFAFFLLLLLKIIPVLDLGKFCRLKVILFLKSIMRKKKLIGKFKRCETFLDYTCSPKHRNYKEFTANLIQIYSFPS